MTRPTEPGYLLRAALIAAVLVGAVASPAAAAAAGTEPDDTDPGLQQTIDADEPVVTGEAVIARGHVDIGPRYIDGTWQLLMRDDSEVPSVWRNLDDTVLQVTDASILQVPDDPAYAFVGAPAGTDVYVVPQTQAADVVWVGWNTQDPDVMSTVDRGATLTLLGVQGPGALTMYLQSGNFSEPDVLWTSTNPEPQPLWVDVNTHTHANWVFTEPGVYLVQVAVSADLVTGESVTDTRTLRFAVGDATGAAEARAATIVAPAASAASTTTTALTDAGSGGSSNTGLLAIIVAAVVVLVGGVVFTVVRGGRARRRAELERTASRAPEPLR